MKTRLLNRWYTFRASYWCVPTLMASAAVGLALVMLALDAATHAWALRNSGWVYRGGPAGARTLLSTIAGSMITVASVTFSITIVALTLASSQFGPRLLRSFMRDVGNQVVLGTFIATFIYCLLVLRTVRDGDSGGFVPHMAVTGGIVAALASLGVLIYFIHHVSVLMQAEYVIAAVGRDLQEAITRLFPEPCGDGAAPPAQGKLMALWTEQGDAHASCIRAMHSGYVQAFDLDGLVRLATAHDLCVRLTHRAGHFLTQGNTLALVWPGDRIDDTLVAQINGAYILGKHRTLEQDAEFAMQQLVEIALRALSPGINDPFTAMTCIDWLGAALCHLTERAFPSSCYYDTQGTLRLIANPVTFAGITDAAFNQLRQAAGTNVAVTIRLLETIAVVAACARYDAARTALRRQATLIAQGSRAYVHAEQDRQDIEERYQAVVRALATAEVPFERV